MTTHGMKEELVCPHCGHDQFIVSVTRVRDETYSITDGKWDFVKGKITFEKYGTVLNCAKCDYAYLENNLKTRVVEKALEEDKT